MRVLIAVIVILGCTRPKKRLAIGWPYKTAP